MIEINPYLKQSTFKKIFIVGESLNDYFRIEFIRKIGKISFLTLSKDLISVEAMLINYKETLKKGNIVYLRGIVVLNNRKRPVLNIKEIQVKEEGKALLDSNYYELKDIADIRRLPIYRLSRMKEVILEKAIFYQELRTLLREKMYLETPCPIISSEYGGATSKSFTVQRNQKSYYLSICPELYLKRYLLAGFSKVYSIHRCFRNEGFDKTHYPEFDMVEIYNVGSDAKKMRDLFFQFVRILSKRYDIPTGYKTKNYFLDRNFTMTQYEQELQNNKGWLVVEGLPHSESPLCKEREKGISDQIEIYFDNLEIANIYTEETNCNRLKESFSLSRGGIGTKDNFLEDFLFQIPPTGGMGFGMERLLTVILGKKRLEEVLPFIIPEF